MKQFISKLSNMLEAVTLAMHQLGLDDDRRTLSQLETQMLESDFWSNPDSAEVITRQAAELRRYIDTWQTLAEDLSLTLELIEIEADDSAEAQFASTVADLEKRYDELMIATKLNGEFDKNPALVQISAGVGGTDAQDWAEMLMTMYIKYANSHNLAVEVLETSYGEEAGIKSATLRISGPFAYGKLLAEKGVHRLVRLSPFNSDNLRQTSFALVDVVPELTDTHIHLDEKDLKIDTYRSSGHGGQSVNTTDSAVRITHLPTGLTVAIQNERSQLKNKQRALSILQSKLAELARSQKLDDISKLRGTVKSADWGAQIRSYVLHPYNKVKDHRTSYETSDTAGVLGGEIEPFIEAYLDQKIKK